MKVKKGIYRHYKCKTRRRRGFGGQGYYKVLGVAKHSETLEDLVVYQGLYNCEEFGKNPIWVRPLKLFIDEVEVDGKMIPRFKRIKS